MSMISAWFLLVLLLLPPAEMRMARVIAGEAGVGDSCPRAAKVAIAHMLGEGRNGIFYADAAPDAVAVEIALNWRALEDPTPTARFILSREDAESGVLDVGREVGRWPCAGGALELRAYEAVR